MALFAFHGSDTFIFRDSSQCRKTDAKAIAYTLIVFFAFSGSGTFITGGWLGKQMMTIPNTLMTLFALRGPIHLSLMT